MTTRVIGIAALVGLLAAAPARPEVIEEIVAKVNDDIITMSELEREEQGLMAELYRQYTGEALDAQVQQARAVMLQSNFHLVGRPFSYSVKVDSVTASSYAERGETQREETEVVILITPHILINPMEFDDL